MMTGFRSWFDAHWETIEVIGLRVTGGWIALLGALTVLGNTSASETGKLFAFPVGTALILVGILTADRSREDLVTGVVAGIAAIVLTFAIASSNAADPEAANASAYPVVLVLLGIALFGLRAFRGAFRRRRDPGLVSRENGSPEP